MIVGADARKTLQFQIPQQLLKFYSSSLAICSLVLGYFCLDYVELRSLRKAYFAVVVENNHLKGEAKVLGENLDEVKSSLQKIESYSTKIEELMQVTTDRFAKKTGIGPLSIREDSLQRDQTVEKHKMPLGINLEQLTFKSVFQKLFTLSSSADSQTLQLQSILSALTEQHSILTSIPSVSPLSAGWITSRFGSRVSPFTGDISQHKGIDIAAPVGTAVYAPADGVVVFSGEKEGYGNFVLLAHGYGVVSGYGHNAQNLVGMGQMIKKGDNIATVGQSGRTTGPHLHYETWVNGKTANPEKFILNIEQLGVH